MKQSILLFIFIFIDPTEQWLSITQISNVSFENEDICDIKYGFNNQQRRFCQNNKQLMPYVYIGTNLAIEQCQLQFQNRHWNCTLFKDKYLIGNILNSGTKESAYIHALATAGIAYAITKACSSGRIQSCGCDMTMKNKYFNQSSRWTATTCSDNVLFATEITRKFVNLREYRTKTEISLLNLHNNQVGIRTVLSSVDQQCKCHGMSGSCEFKTCWHSLRSFIQIANQLKEFYDNSIEVYSKQNFIDKKLEFFPKNLPIQMKFKNNLIYSNSSPNYCLFNLTLGSFGTKGRICDRNSRAINGCDLLCCNRGYESQIMTIHSQCNCRFQWCCHVQCQNCIITKEISRCL